MGRNRTESDNLKDTAERLISLAQAAEICGISPSQLRLLVRRDIIWGRKIGRNWLTTEEAVREYLARGVRPGPRPRSAPGQV